MDRRVAIVGAGYAGMAAAVALAERGIRVTVFEAGAVPGGRARRIASHGHELDNGQHIFVGAYTGLWRAMRTVGVPSDAVLRLPLEIRYTADFSFRQLWLPAPLGLVGGLLLAKGIPFGERLGAVRFMGFLRKASFRLERDIPVKQLLEEHGQDGRIGHYLWRPICVAALNTPIEEASANVYLAVLRDALAGEPGASDLMLPRVDLSRLFPEPAAHYITARGGELRCGTVVKELGALRKDFSGVIVAVGPHQLKPLLPYDAPYYSYQPIYTCYLQYPERVQLPFPMLGMAGGLAQWVFDRGALTGERGRLACVISAQGDHQSMTLDEIGKACHHELARAFPLPAPLWSRAIAEKRATISCVPGLARPQIETPIPGVYLAGDYTDPEYPPTLEAAVRSGVRAAQRAARGL
jgi:squalene-associated FAD-dependent desaturase